MKTIKQIIIFNATPEELYNWIMDSKKHSEFTGSKAVIGERVGDKFTAWDGYIDGVNVKLVPGKEIVQTWHASDWPAGDYSKISFKFKKDKAGTKMEFTQTGVPDGHYEEIKKGWYDNYWDLLHAQLEK